MKLVDADILITDIENFQNKISQILLEVLNSEEIDEQQKEKLLKIIGIEEYFKQRLKHLPEIKAIPEDWFKEQINNPKDTEALDSVLRMWYDYKEKKELC